MPSSFLRYFFLVFYQVRSKFKLNVRSSFRERFLRALTRNDFFFARI